MTASQGPGVVLRESLREIHLMTGLNFDRIASDQSVAIGVTSPNYGDGKSTIAIGLAFSLAHDFGVDVTLVDGDLTTSSVAQEFGLEKADGLSEVLKGNLDLAAVSHQVNRHITVIPAGRPAVDPGPTARSESLVTLIENIKRTSRFVVIDLPASLHSMTAPMLARRCDGVIVVGRSRSTQRSDLERTLQLLKDSNVLGIVVNRNKSRVPRFVARALNLAS